MSVDTKTYKRFLDMRNSEPYQKLQQFYHRKTIFDILGVARQENPHSSFLSWLLTPGESHGMGDFPMRRFLETVYFAYMKYGAEYLSAKNPSYQEYCKQDTVRQKAADSKLLFFQGPSPSKEPEKLRDALMLGDYRIASCGVAREHILTAKRRADIYIDATLDVGGALSHILILIENKVHSDENDNQTKHYMNHILALDVDYIIPIFLYPVSNSQLYQASKAMMSTTKGTKAPCTNRLFLLLNYQFLVDGVISPCRTAFSNEKIHEILTEYIACLGKSIDCTDTPSNTQAAAVMAVSQEEKDLSCQLWEAHSEVLTDICKELSGMEHETSFISGDSDRQFYRTVLSSILAHEEDMARHSDDQGASDARNEAIAILRDASEIRQRAAYAVRQQNGSLWQFRSGGRGNESLGALAYTILKQYTLLHPEKTAQELQRGLLKHIHHSWLHSIILTKDDIKVLCDQWVAHYRIGSPVCPWRASKDTPNNSWLGCPLEDNLKRVLRTKSDAVILQSHGCPLHTDLSNEELYKWYCMENHQQICVCLYDVVADFFVRDLADIIRGQDWGTNGVDAALIFEEEAVIRCHPNKTFGAIRSGSDFFVVGRWWDTSTIDTLLSVLEMQDYVDIGLSGTAKALDFDITNI